MRFLRTLPILVLVHHAWTTAVQRTGETVEVGGIAYYLPPTPIIRISGGSALKRKASGQGLLPITIISASNVSTAHFGSIDDAWTKHFEENVYVADGRGDSKIIPQGPYFLSPLGDVYEAWRLYSDFAGAFTETVIGSRNGSYSVLPANVPGQALAIAVPSRLYYTKTPAKPLAGVRVGIKDIFDLAGVRTGNGNRAWYHLYSPATANALPVRRLIDAGAIIVGKTKASQFAFGSDWVDYLSSFSPRADGYQTVGGSSTGSAAGAASYPWLDVTLGTDTIGSIRGVAAGAGVYGNRPTHGLVALEGVMPLGPQFDTAGLMARDPIMWMEAAKALYLDNITISHAYPKKVVAYTFDVTAQVSGNQQILDFVTAVAKYLGAEVINYNLDESWSKTRPDGAPAKLLDLLPDPLGILTGKEQAKLVRDPFYRDYAAEWDDRKPYVDAGVVHNWKVGDDYPESAIDETIKNLTIFSNWFAQNGLRSDNDTCSDRLLFYPSEFLTPSYVTKRAAAPSLGNIELSTYWGGPDFTLPVGQASYNSSVSEHVEYLPLATQVMAAKGCDGMLFGLIEDLLQAGILKSLQPGYSAFKGGEVVGIGQV